jgi:predicted AlkP superfamily pyrophosphatase or phosphodiesterase
MIKNIIFTIAIFLSFYSVTAQIKNKIPPEKPTLIIGIVVEQMRFEYLDRFWNKFEKDGFKRLIGNGTNCKNTNINYMFTQTSPGFATIYTGTNPSVNGIVADEWYKINGNLVESVKDDKYKGVGTTREEIGHYSPRNILTTTVSDEMKISDKLSKVFSISMNKESSVISGGHMADGVFTWDEISGNWISSSYYYDSLPTWVNEFNKKKFHETYLLKEWNTLLDINKYTESRNDTAEYEYGIGTNRQSVFPYQLGNMSNMANKNKIKNYSILEQVPYGNNFTKDFAISTIVNENLGKDKHTDFISISFSSTENIGQRYGPYSVEVEDTYLRLDKEIAHFLSFIADFVGKENVLIFLTSNHGVAEIPEYSKQKRLPSGQFKGTYSIALLKSYLNAIYGEGEWISGYKNQQIYLNKNLIETSKYSVQEVQQVVAEFVLQFSGVANIITSTQMMQTNFSQGSFAKMQNSFNQKRSGDIMINLKPGWIEDVTFATFSNSPYTYDTHVPLVWYGWKIKRKTIFKEIGIEDIAPSISSMLNISFPNGYSGTPIYEIWE